MFSLFLHWCVLALIPLHKVTAFFKIAPSNTFPMAFLYNTHSSSQHWLCYGHNWYRGQGGILCQPSGTSRSFCLDIKMFSLTKFMTKMCFPNLQIFWHDEFTELKINHMVSIILKQKEGTSGCVFKNSLCLLLPHEWIPLHEKVSLVAVKSFMRCSYTWMWTLECSKQKDPKKLENPNRNEQT